MPPIFTACLLAGCALGGLEGPTLVERGGAVGAAAAWHGSYWYGHLGVCETLVCRANAERHCELPVFSPLELELGGLCAGVAK